MKRLQLLILFSVAILVKSMFLFQNWPKGQEKNYCGVRGSGTGRGNFLLAWNSYFNNGTENEALYSTHQIIPLI